jgi:hypothetical protein
MIMALHIDLGANYRFDPCFSGEVIEPDGSGQPVVIGQRQGGHAEVFCFLEKPGRAGGPVMEAVIGVDVKMHKRHGCALKEVSQSDGGGTNQSCFCTTRKCPGFCIRQ